MIWPPSANWSASKSPSIRIWTWRRFGAASVPPAARPCISRGLVAAVFRCWPICSARSNGRDILRDTLGAVERLIALKLDPAAALKHPGQLLSARQGPRSPCSAPGSRGPILAERIKISDLPRVQAWPRRRRAIHYTAASLHRRSRSARLASLEPGHVSRATWWQFCPNAEVGLHYQIHRGIGVHHAAAIRRGERLRVSVFVGGTTAMTVAAVMPLPEGLSGVVVCRSLRPGIASRWSACRVHPTLYAEADFCLTGYIDPHRLLPEGPFGDHLGYYAWRMTFRCYASTSVLPARSDLALYRGRPSTAGRYDVRRIHSRADWPRGADAWCRVCTRFTRSMRPECIRCCWRSAASSYVPYVERRRPQELLTQGQRDSGPGAACRWPSIC